MASILKIADKWRVQIRRRNAPSICQTFDCEGEANAWASQQEKLLIHARRDALVQINKNSSKPWLKAEISQLSKFSLDDFCGIYFLHCGSELVYIGQAVQVPRRVEEHIRAIQFDSWSWIKVPKHQLTEAEIFFIRKHRPKLNRTHNVRGNSLAMTPPKPA